MNTMMALWNRGWKGRLSVMILAFFCLCISTSLLVITAGSTWGALFVQKHAATTPTHTAYRLRSTPTDQPGEATATATATATTTVISVPNPCLISATPDEHATTKPSGTRIVRSKGKLHATPTHIYPQHTPTPIRRPSPSPTHSTVTPTAVLSPTPSSIPSPVVTPTQLPTPTSVPTIPPTPVVTPTSTPTPVVTATGTITPVDTPTATVTPRATVSPGVQPTGTPTAFGSPAATPTLAGTTQSGHTGVGVSISGGFSPYSQQNDTGGASASSDASGATGNCLGDTLMFEGPSPLLLSLQLEFWVILSTSLAGTIIFCGMLARAARASAKS